MSKYVKKSFKASDTEEHVDSYSSQWAEPNENLDEIPDLTGKSFGSLKVIKKIGGTDKRPIYLCHCGCGKEVKRTLEDIFLRDRFNCQVCSRKLIKAGIYKYSIPNKGRYELRMDSGEDE